MFTLFTLTWAEFRWAAGIVMSRQNNLLLEVRGEAVETLGLVPLWDMFNHGPGEPATYMAGGHLVSEAVAAVAKGRQVYMVYGARPNLHLLLYQGFVQEENPHDELSVTLAGSTAGPRVAALAALGLKSPQEQPVATSAAALAALRRYARVLSLTEAPDPAWLAAGGHEPLSPAVEAAATRLLVTAFTVLLRRLPARDTAWLRSERRLYTQVIALLQQEDKDKEGNKAGQVEKQEKEEVKANA